MEQHYDQTNGKVWNYYRERKQRKEDLIKELENLKKLSDYHPSGFNADQFLNAFFKMESKFLRHKRAKWKCNDFRTLKILGQGVFGSVSLVRNKNYEKVPNYSPNDSNGTMSKIAKQNKNLFDVVVRAVVAYFSVAFPYENKKCLEGLAPKMDFL